MLYKRQGVPSATEKRGYIGPLELFWISFSAFLGGLGVICAGGHLRGFLAVARGLWGSGVGGWWRGTTEEVSCGTTR